MSCLVVFIIHIISGLYTIQCELFSMRPESVRGILGESLEILRERDPMHQIRDIFGMEGEEAEFGQLLQPAEDRGKVLKDVPTPPTDGHEGFHLIGLWKTVERSEDLYRHGTVAGVVPRIYSQRLSVSILQIDGLEMVGNHLHRAWEVLPAWIEVGGEIP